MCVCLFIMLRRFILAYVSFLFLPLLLLQTCQSLDCKHILCPRYSSCGIIQNITTPFRLDTDPKNCGSYRSYNLSCENNSTVLYLYTGKYFVKAINYDNFTIRVVDAGIQEGNCSSLPRFTLLPNDFKLGDPFTTSYYKTQVVSWRPRFPMSSSLKWSHVSMSESISFINCPNSMASPLYKDTTPCLSSIVTHVSIGGMKASELMEQCSIERITLLPKKENIKTTYKEIHRDLAYGFELSWYNLQCEGTCKYGCFMERNHRICIDNVLRGESLIQSILKHIRYFILDYLKYILIFLGLVLGVRFCVAIPIAIGLLIHKWRSRHLSVHLGVERFLRRNNNFMLVRYSYLRIRQMTGDFKDKLGEGGFGTVYKGKLSSGGFAAIKVLGKSDKQGQDFINEVATIGRIHHANIVPLIGFCAEGSKRALVYEFMPSGSLNRFIFSLGQGSVYLSWKKLHEISLGVARGIEYLHHGCEMRILHFDIKPHNILLNENFIPKVSDFGLATLYPRHGKISSPNEARGTRGYMAPEMFYPRIGRLSYKSDVYSFGMLLLEMGGRRRNFDEMAENSGQSYWPYWAYDQLSNGKGIEVGDNATEEEIKLVKKMVIVGLWCIQMIPTDRPSMDQVVEMLEGDLESLELPPKPVLDLDNLPAFSEGEPLPCLADVLDLDDTDT